MINVRTKGLVGEQEVARALNAKVQEVLDQNEWPQHIKESTAFKVQRNQNQSAVGGCDLQNTFGLAFEIKRQEAVSVDAWWKQCLKSAIDRSEIPVLVYRKNHQPWRVVMYLQNPLPVLQPQIQTAPRYASTTVRAEFAWDEFLDWFGLWVHRKLLNGDIPNGA
jgi:hypothetical protein